MRHLDRNRRRVSWSDLLVLLMLFGGLHLTVFLSRTYFFLDTQEVLVFPLFLEAILNLLFLTRHVRVVLQT